SAMFGLAIAAVGCGDTIQSPAEPGGSKGPEIARAKTETNPVAGGASAGNPTAPPNGMLTPAAPTACHEGAACAVVDATCEIIGSMRACTCAPAEAPNSSPTWSCD